MATGLPPIVSTAGVLPDYVRHRENGFVFPVGNVEALADCLAEMVDEPQLRESFGHRCRSLTETTWSHEQFLERLEWLYQRAIHHRPWSGKVEDV